MKNKLVYIVLFVGFCVNMFACSDGKGEALLPEPIPNPTPVPKYTLPTGKLIYIPDELQSNDFTKDKRQLRRRKVSGAIIVWIIRIILSFSGRKVSAATLLQ